MRIILGLLALVWLKEALWAQVLLGGVILVGIAAVVWVVFEHLLNAEPEPVFRRRVEPGFDDPGARRSDQQPDQQAEADPFTDGGQEFATEGDNPFGDMDAAALARFMAHLIATKTALEGEVSRQHNRLKVLEAEAAGFPARLREAANRGRDEVLHAFGHDREKFESLLCEFARRQHQQRDRSHQEDRDRQEETARKGQGQARRTRSAKPWWEVLGVPPTATEDEVRRAYRTLAKRFHPDRRGTGDAARMAEINTARDEALRWLRQAA